VKGVLEGICSPCHCLSTQFHSLFLLLFFPWQVYKAKLRKTGDTVAVKVQRPGVLEGICCDLLVLRIMAKAFQKLPYVHTDLLDVLDTWARRFFDELDYIQEVCDVARYPFLCIRFTLDFQWSIYFCSPPP